jgi:hypothetical protein
MNKTVVYPNVRSDNSQQLIKISGVNTSQQLIEIIKVEHMTADHRESQDSFQDNSLPTISGLDETVAHQKHQDSSSSKMSAGYRESQNETPNTAAYQKCQDRMENKSAGHRDC